MTQVNCRQRKCLNWDEGICAAEDITVDKTGVCLTQDEYGGRLVDAPLRDRLDADEHRNVPFVDDDDDEDDGWEDDDWSADDDAVEDDEDWDDDEWAEDDSPRRQG